MSKKISLLEKELTMLRKLCFSGTVKMSSNGNKKLFGNFDSDGNLKGCSLAVRIGNPNSYVFGEFKAGCLNGFGVSQDDDVCYSGEWNNHTKEGEGIQEINIGEDSTPYYFMGDYKNGKKSGQGVCIDFDGSCYTGEFQNNEYHGHGVRKMVKYGQVYTGIFENGKSDSGVMKYDDGSVFEGKMDENFEACLEGKFTNKEGVVFDGTLTP